MMSHKPGSPSGISASEASTSATRISSAMLTDWARTLVFRCGASERTRQVNHGSRRSRLSTYRESTAHPPNIALGMPSAESTVRVALALVIRQINVGEHPPRASKEARLAKACDRRQRWVNRLDSFARPSADEAASQAFPVEIVRLLGHHWDQIR